MTDHDVPKPCLSRSWTERLHCALPQGHKGHHTNQTVTDVRQVKWIDEPEAPVLPARPTASTITDAQLDTLYERLERAETENAELRDTLAHCHERGPRLRAEAALARVRKLHRPVGIVAAAEAGVPPECAACRRSYPCQTVDALPGPATVAATQATDTAPIVDRPFRSHRQPKEQP